MNNEVSEEYDYDPEYDRMEYGGFGQRTQDALARIAREEEGRRERAAKAARAKLEWQPGTPPATDDEGLFFGPF